MKKSRLIETLRAGILLPLLALLCTGSWAARDFTPQAGTWVISEELDGKPGRGLAIDVQGNTFFMQMFGYEKNGNATFYTATGQMDGNSVTAPLMQYQGGRSFGSDARDAEVLGSPGPVTVSFVNGLQGTVQLPGEPEREIKRFEVMSPYYTKTYLEYGMLRSLLINTLDTKKEPQWLATAQIVKSFSEEWILGFGSFLSNHPFQWLTCQQIKDKDEYQCLSDKMPPAGYEDPYVLSARLRIVNVDAVGEVEVLYQGVLQKLPFVGVVTAGSPFPNEGSCDRSSDLYVGDVDYCFFSISPVSGTWIVKDEANYKPGRGIALDVQAGMAVAQIFNYLPDGTPTFHMGSGTYAGAATSFELNRYRGGRALGGPLKSAKLAEAAGEIKLEFMYDGEGNTAARRPSRLTGDVQFPGEAPKQIVRMALEPGAETAEGLLGQWWLHFIGMSNWLKPTPVTLSRIEGNEAINQDGTIRCSRQIPHVPRRAQCIWNRDGQTYTAYFNQQQGDRSFTILQVRDRHGNLMGLGDIPLE